MEAGRGLGIESGCYDAQAESAASASARVPKELLPGTEVRFLVCNGNVMPRPGDLVVLFGLLVFGASSAAAEGKAFKVGILTTAMSPWHTETEGFRDGLKELGYIDGRNVLFVARAAQGDPVRLRGRRSRAAETGYPVLRVEFRSPGMPSRNQDSTDRCRGHRRSGEARPRPELGATERKHHGNRELAGRTKRQAPDRKSVV